MKKLIVFLNLLFLLAACATPTQKWLNNQNTFAEFKDEAVIIQLANINESDTTDLEYRVRVFSSKEIYEISKEENFIMSDSCFVLKAGNQEYLPQVVEPVTNGIMNCREYLLIYKIYDEMVGKSLAFIYDSNNKDYGRRILTLNEKD